MADNDEKSSVSSSNKPTATVQRYQRYKTVVDYVVEQSTIELKTVKQACQPERSQFITRVIKELEHDGWLMRESNRESVFRWNKGKGEFSPKRWLDKQIYGSQITLKPTEERPRERLLALGADQLKTSELIAILIRSGIRGESAIDAAEKVARQFDNRLAELSQAGRGELNEISAAINVTAYCQIMAGIELGRRVAAVSNQVKTIRILSSNDAIEFCQQRFSRLVEDGRQEEFHIVTLNTKNGVIDTHQITVGTLDASLVHPREVFLKAIRDAASSIILVHNHPSGDPAPSSEDLAVTRRLEECGVTLGIDVLDHIVLGKTHSVSIREHRE